MEIKKINRVCVYAEDEEGNTIVLATPASARICDSRMEYGLNGDWSLCFSLHSNSRDAFTLEYDSLFFGDDMKFDDFDSLMKAVE